MGEECDVVDLLLGAKQIWDMNFMLCADVQHKEELHPQPATDYLEGLVSPEHLDLPSPDTRMGILVLCSSGFGGAGINHFVPAFCAEELGDEDFEKLAAAWTERHQKHLSYLKTAIKKASNKLQRTKLRFGDGSENVELALVELASLEGEWTQAAQWHDFQKKCHRSKLHAIEVPADGNCMLWSVKCLVEDDIHGLKCDADSQEHVAVIRKWRSKLAARWTEVRNSDSWQLLYEQMYVASDAQVRFAEASGEPAGEPSVKRELSTPPRQARRDPGDVSKSTPEEKKQKKPKPGDVPKEHGNAPKASQEEKKQTRPQRIASTRTAPGFSSPVINQKFAKKTSAGRKKQKKQKKCKANIDENGEAGEQVEGEDDIEDEIDVDVAETKGLDEKEGAGRRPRKPRGRAARRKVTDRDVKLTALKRYMAKMKITYYDWQTEHWRQDWGIQNSEGMGLQTKSYSHRPPTHRFHRSPSLYS